MKIKDVFIFIAGAAIGSGISFFVTKKALGDKIEKQIEERLEAQYQEELKSVKESFAYLAEEDKKKAAAAKDKPSIDVYVNALNKVKEQESEAEAERINYSDPKTILIEKEIEDEIYSSDDEENEEDESTAVKEPYILKKLPNDDYNCISVTYYADGTYADFRDTEIEIEEYIGKKMMDYVASSNKDEIFIRNEDLELDIDIVKDNRTYDEVMFG